jgi:site-specific DNA recombinase
LGVSEIAQREGDAPGYVSRLLELAFLQPKLVEAILAGAQPPDITAETLTRRERGLVVSRLGTERGLAPQ